MKKSHFLISHEDYWSIWIGGFVLMVGLFLFFINAPKDYVIQHEKYEAIQAEERAKAPFKTIKWYDAFRSKQKIKASSETIGKFFKKLTSKPSSWNSNPLESFHKSASNFKDAKKELAIKLVNAVEETKLQKRLAEETQVTAAKSKFENIKFSWKQRFVWHVTKRSIKPFRIFRY